MLSEGKSYAIDANIKDASGPGRPHLAAPPPARRRTYDLWAAVALPKNALSEFSNRTLTNGDSNAIFYLGLMLDPPCTISKSDT
ncbi:hypothetical protein EVAR_27877_1 [Eumeta japonica]|uniref:Uncharacterized protein n=1 Tax=Eumeta variegata TaxID=151549 RepID=A0A4C1UV07_EUMVA|nr:hypothetical protein EVAR_27877_1 [Eumeta japonica]